MPWWKAFRLGRCRVPFNVFEMTLMTGLPIVGTTVVLDSPDVNIDKEVVELAYVSMRT